MKIQDIINNRAKLEESSIKQFEITYSDNTGHIDKLKLTAPSEALAVKEFMRLYGPFGHKVTGIKLLQSFAKGQERELDPDSQDEMLPLSTVRKIVREVMATVDPTAKVRVSQPDDDIYYKIEVKGKDGNGLDLEFSMLTGAAGPGTIHCEIQNAHSSYTGRNAVTAILGRCRDAMVQLYGKPSEFSLSPYEDRGHGVWQHIAQKLGATYGGSIMEATLGSMLTWPEVYNEISRVMRSMGWDSKRRSEDSCMFTVRGSAENEWYTAIIQNKGNNWFTYALGTVEEGDPHIGVRNTLPMTQASVSEFIDAVREGFGLDEENR